MPADPETLTAIHTFGENIRNAINAELCAHKEEADRARQRLYDHINHTAKESRDEQRLNTAELRGSITTLGIQVTDLASRFGSHEKADVKEVERIDNELNKVDEKLASNANKKHGYIQAFIAAVFGGIAGWISRHFEGNN